MVLLSFDVKQPPLDSALSQPVLKPSRVFCRQSLFGVVPLETPTASQVRSFWSFLPASFFFAAAHAGPVWACATAPSSAINATSGERGKDLLPEPVLRRVKSGEYWFRVVPADAARFHDNYSRPFWEAAAANEDKYDLDSATCGLRDKATGKVPDFYFGYPFPKIDPKDPEAGCKIAWNFTAASLMAGGTGASFYLNGVDKDGAYRTIRTKIQATSFVGRHGGPIPNPEHLVGKATSVALEPVDVEGVSTLTVRHLDWKTPDDMWAYVPQTRRARHISAASRSDPVAGMDIFADDINCFAGKVETYKWKLVGEGHTLAPVVGQPYALEQRAVSPTRWLIDTPPLRANFEAGKGHKGAPWHITENLGSSRLRA